MDEGANRKTEAQIDQGQCRPVWIAELWLDNVVWLVRFGLEMVIVSYGEA
jgi:hypothetical protein